MGDLSVFTANAPLVLVGCGNMGRALMRGWLSAGLPPEGMMVVDPVASADTIPGTQGVAFAASPDLLPDGLQARAMLVAVKPQMMNDVLTSVGHLTNEDTVVISVAAGVMLDQMLLGLQQAGAAQEARGMAVLVRAMPNTPAAIGAGVTGLVAADGASAADKALVDTLMQAAGTTVWLEDEGMMDAVTATSGSGPAYVFHLVEALAVAAENAGLSSDEAMVLARQTIIGAARLLEADSGVSAAELRTRVTSPGGTTAAALEVLMANKGLTDLMTRAVAAAKKRSQDLAN